MSRLRVGLPTAQVSDFTASIGSNVLCKQIIIFTSDISPWKKGSEWGWNGIPASGRSHLGSMGTELPCPSKSMLLKKHIPQTVIKTINSHGTSAFIPS